MKTIKLLLTCSMLALMFSGVAATITITGVVASSNGTPQPNVTVVYTDSITNNGDTALTDSRGMYTLNINTGTFTQGQAYGYIVDCNGNFKWDSFYYSPAQSSYTRNFVYCTTSLPFTATINGTISNLPSTGTYTVWADTLMAWFNNTSTTVSQSSNNYSLNLVCYNSPQTVYVYFIDCKGDSLMQTVTVSTSATTVSGVNFNYCTSSSTSSVSGTVYTGGLPAGAAEVLLIEKKAGKLNAVASTMTQRGAYSFNNVDPTKTYYIKAYLDSTDSLYNFYMPTYSDLALYWNNGNIIPAAPAKSYTRDVNLIAGLNTGGPGFIGGKISQGANKSSAVGDPIEGAQVMLVQGTQAVTYTYSDANGDFSFDNLAYGTYTVYTEVPGLPTTSANVTLSASNESEEGVKVSVNSTGVTTWVEASSIESFGAIKILTAYPNPVQHELMIDFGAEIKGGELTLLDMNGQELYHQVVDGVTETSVPFDQVKAGNYLLRVASNNGSSVIRVVKH